GFERALHPAGPRGRVLAGEVDAAFLPRERVDEADLPRRVQRERSALPRLEAPAVRHAPFALACQFGEDLPRLIERCGDAPVFRHRLELRRVLADRIRRERAARAGIRARIGGEPLDRQVGGPEAAPGLLPPETPCRL